MHILFINTAFRNEKALFSANPEISPLRHCGTLNYILTGLYFGRVIRLKCGLPSFGLMKILKSRTKQEKE